MCVTGESSAPWRAVVLSVASRAATPLLSSAMAAVVSGTDLSLVLVVDSWAIDTRPLPIRITLKSTVRIISPLKRLVFTLWMALILGVCPCASNLIRTPHQRQDCCSPRHDVPSCMINRDHILD